MKKNNDLSIAKDLRDNKKYTIAVVRDGSVIYKSKERGILPLYNAYIKGIDFSGASAADKIVGKGAAIFFEKLKPKNLHTQIISKPAISYLQSSGVVLSYEKLVEYIANRAKDGRCPVETMAEISSGFDAFADDVEQFLKRLELI